LQSKARQSKLTRSLPKLTNPTVHTVCGHDFKDKTRRVLAANVDLKSKKILFASSAFVIEACVREQEGDVKSTLARLPFVRRS